MAAPPYDVIDDAMRAELSARSPFNVVEIDLPRADNGGDPYLHAQTTLEAWQQQGVLVREREPAIWVLTQDYRGPDGKERSRLFDRRIDAERWLIGQEGRKLKGEWIDPQAGRTPVRPPG